MKTVLVVDDEASLRNLVRTTLESDSYRILEASDGNEALEIAIVEKPDLIVVDWMMPGRTGIEVVVELRKTVDGKDIPIIMLTARGQKVDMERGAEAGVTVYLVKPFSPLELIDTVEQLLGSAF
ncbi:MAG: response regulator [Phycisphaerales bacterium]|jgi:DNA-binding response OmpR family regulator|nr:response regulator [Phycisphaerales bacterium]